jgi:hypothetical protein
MPDLLIYKDFIQLGFAGAFMLLFVLLWWVLRSSNKERSEFRHILNDTQHDHINAMNNVAGSISENTKAISNLDKTMSLVMLKEKLDKPQE